MEEKKTMHLETGTNELELVEFTIGDNTFGINVAKVTEIMPYTRITKVPNPHPCVKGIFKPRDQVMAVIDLPKYLNLPDSVDEKKDFFIISNFNKLHVAFEVQAVVGIHRITWADIEKPDDTIFGGQDGLATGVAKIDDQLVIILDFEKITTDIAPQTGIMISEIDSLGTRERSEKPILIAEDSELLERMISDSLKKSGYVNVTICPDGQVAWDKLQEYKAEKGKSIFDSVACIITDLEMPKMDGHRLTKLVKDDDILKDIPVIIFSSLINEDMRKKGELLGAEGQISKPEIGKLVSLIDNLTNRG